MKIAVASGKGGTGKTTLAVNLALAAEGPVQLLDCDVEAPNAHLFLRAEPGEAHVVSVPVPRIDPDLCGGCGACARFCAFNALAAVGNRVMVFPELCHGCGGCAKVCPNGAITEIDRPIGVVERRRAGAVSLIMGRLDIGVAMAPPLIRAVKAAAEPGSLTILDAPPGAACPAVETLRTADMAILVTEPTAFGLHDLKLAVEMLRELGVPFGVVVNRVGVGDERVHRYCAEHCVTILAEIPDDRRIAEAYSRGETIVEVLPEYRPLFTDLLERLMQTAGAV